MQRLESALEFLSADPNLKSLYVWSQIHSNWSNFDDVILGWEIDQKYDEKYDKKKYDEKHYENYDE